MIWGLKQKTASPQKNQSKPEGKQQAEEKIIECVPNFSVGHDSAVIHKIVDSIKSASVDVIDQSYDEDHNRLVVTFIGTPEKVLKDHRIHWKRVTIPDWYGEGRWMVEITSATAV